MVRITKTIQPKHVETLSPFVSEFGKAACSISLPLLPQHLAQFPTRWPFPRGDLYHWISLLNRFDVILERFCTTYKLADGPQKMDFGREMLESNVKATACDAKSYDLSELGYGEDGDRQLIEAILKFSKMLLENCGNRSIYSSSPHLGSLLNTSSMSLLENTLLVTSQLAQRYNSAMKRVGSARSTKHLLAEHYNLDLNRVLQLALPFSKTITTPQDSAHPATPNPTTPGAKGKEKDKAYFNLPVSHKSSTTVVYANDLVSIYKGGSGVSTTMKGPRRGSDHTSSPISQTGWDEWGDVRMTYYPKIQPEAEQGNSASKPADTITTPVPPVTPTPVRRSSNLGPNAHRANRPSTAEETSPTLARTPTMPSDDAQRQNAKTIEISSAKLRSTDIYSLMEEYGSDLPQDLQYELFTKIRIAKALTSSLETRQQALVIRMLAVANMANVYAEPLFLENVMKQDGDEPKRLQFIYQVADLVHPPAEGDIAVSTYMQTLAFSTLEAIAGISTKFQDVCKALNTTINHGVMLYVIRKAVAEMAVEDLGDKLTDKDQWRNALFSLMTSLCQYPRTAEGLVTAGLIPIMIEILGLRTTVAQRYQPKTLTFLDNVVYSAREAFQILVNANGLDRVSDLIVHETTAASGVAGSGNGMPKKHRSPSTDYEIPFYQQQILKWLFKFIHHMMSSANSYGGNFDRLLRNLIDSSQLLGSLRQIIGNGRCFGSIVWTNAVGILNGFINNEPTSFAIIAEAGLSKGFLEAITGSPIVMPQLSRAEDRPADSSRAVNGGSSAASSDEEDDEPLFELDTTPHPPTLEMLQAPRDGPLARGIMPTQETINIVPQAFSALCLNNTGMKMFRASRALESFFEIFESPEHVKCMESSGELPSSLGSTFDELARHHPPLKGAIINAILDMVVRVGYLCKTKAEKDRAGAKLWTSDSAGRVVAAGFPSSISSDSKGKGKATDNGSDVEMRDADDSVPAPASAKDSDTSMTPYITSVASFLATVLNNSSVRTEFCARGGIEYVLDLAESQSLPANFGDGISSRNLQNVIALLAEQKPYLVIPSLLKRAQAAADILEPFATHDFGTSFFAPFVGKENHYDTDSAIIAQGTAFAKAFVNVHSLVANLTASIQGSPYSHRNTPSGFNSMNFADHYNRLIQTLGPLLGASLKEEVLLQKLVPKSWQQISSARIKDNGISDLVPDAAANAEPSSVTPVLAAISDVVSGPTPAVASDPPSRPLHPDYVPTPALSPPGYEGSPDAPIVEPLISPPSKALPPPSTPLKDTVEFRNFGTLRYLLGRMPRVIGPFFQNIGKVLLSKRNPDAYYRQNHATIAEALAESVLKQLARPGDDNSVDDYSYWIGMLHVLKDMLIDSSRHADRQIQTITLVLQAFKERSGFTTLNNILEAFTSEIRASNAESCEQQGDEKTPEKAMKFELATVGTKHILSLYGILVNHKHVIEGPQTLAMIPRNERDRDRPRPDPFTPGQFMVELRIAVLPTVRGLWESNLIEKAPSQISEKIIEVIRTIASTDGENGSVKRSDIQPTRQTKYTRKVFKINPDNVNSLKDLGYDEDLAKEALYRCNNNLPTSTDYCKEQKKERTRGRCPIPDDDIEVAPEPSSNSRPSSGSTGSASPYEQPTGPVGLNPSPETIAIINALPIGSSAAEAATMGVGGSDNDPFTPRGLARLINEIENRNQDTSNSAGPSVPRERSPLKPPQPTKAEEPSVKLVTVDDLNDERKLIRDNLIDKCLDVINAHGDVTFEISDLITTVVNKSSDASGLRKTIGETLVVALMSFAGEEDVRNDGNKIAAYAHLLALMLREKQFFAAAVGELKENLPTLLSFVKLSPSHSTEEPSPWIAQILLIIEMLLSEDAKPRKAKWTPPKDENDKIEAPVLEHVELAVSEDERYQLLESILEILPRIGKEESLALAVLRILVILTRTRAVAQSMGEKKNIQRLFVMAKQLAGASSTRIHGPLLLILRHIVEDEETIKQIMRSDIKTFFDHNVRPQRSPIDLMLYLRGLQHMANRSPALFVQVTNEMVKFTGWPFASSDPTSRAPSLVLKGGPSSENTSSDKISDAVQPAVQATEDLSLQDLKPSTEVIDTDMPDVPKPVSPEHKTPVVENPDGVIHFLLCELLNYRDVEDKDHLTTSHADKPTSSSNGDVAMAGAPAVPDSPTPKDSQSVQPPTKQEFKAKENPIYIYRCFLLQCLTELLASYNRTKIEFINFKRSAHPQAMTPSKPRSSVLHYLLADLLPTGTLDYADYGESTTLRKKAATSHWADSVITALLNKTGEQILDKLREQSDGEDEPDLLFVRRFVLENILKAYKDASASTEPLEIKYARMLSLADLMMHIMTGKDNLGAVDSSVNKRSQMQLKRIMFEKGYITALTASVADIDLNFPGAKRAVKYILRPLKQLTHHAIYLSENSLISSVPGQADEDDIESATSVSDLEDEREETPDLFRNSTLGMFEQGDENDTSSDSEDDDEDMYEGEYDDGMEYEEEMEQDDEENVSDEDEDDDMGPIEGLSGDHGVDVEVIMEDEDEDDDDDDDEDDEDDDSEDDEDDDENGSDGMEDDDARIEIIDEAVNVQQLAEDDEDEGADDWESDNDDDMQEDDDEDFEEGYVGPGEVDDAAHVHAHSMGDMGPIGNLVRVLAGGAGDDEDAVEMLQRLEEEGMGDPEDDEEEQLGEYMEEIEEEEDEEDEDEMDEEMLFEHAYPADGPGPIFGWEGEVEPPMVISHRGHQGRHRHAFPSPFPFLPGGSRDPLGGRSQLSELEDMRRATARQTQELVSLTEMGVLSGQSRQNRTDRGVVPDFRYRTHRSGAPPPHSMDDGTNPLLQRNGPSGSSRTSYRGPQIGSWIPAPGPGGSLIDMSSVLGGRAFGDSPEQILDMIRSLRIPGSIARNGQALQFHITAGPGQLPRELEAMFGTRRPRSDNHRDASEPGSATSFSTQSTIARWSEEAKMLFGSSNVEAAQELKNEIMAVLVPPAIEADKVIKAAEIERIRVLEEEKQKRLEAEKLAREVKEAEEKAAREKKEAEEREAAERAAAEIAAARSNEAGEQIEGSAEANHANATDAMEGIQSEGPEAGTNAATQEAEAPAADRPRVMTVIRGNPFDITDLGIDAEFLAELPEEIREEVIMAAVAERRQQATATGSQPTDIDQEFLDALPDDIREEIMQQEAQERRRRERIERRDASAAAGGAPPNGDMDLPSILATFSPALRQEVLMDGDEDFMASLPPDLAAQARQLRRGQPDHPGHPGRAPVGFLRRVAPGEETRSAPQQPRTRRAIVQMLDKQGVATLLRLMFIFQHSNFRTTLNSVLHNVALNKHNRAELISTLLHILQDGSADMNAIERSFSALSVRAKQPREKDPKTPTQLRRTATGHGSLTQTNSEASPLMVVQQCLTALVYLAQTNLHVASFFLTEHEPSGGLKRSLSRKGKGKDSKAPRYALNSLLSLLDRDLIMESATVMEQLSLLLNIVTSPLIALERKQKEAIEEAEKSKAATTVIESADTTAPTNITNPEAVTTGGNEPTEQPQALPETATSAINPSTGPTSTPALSAPVIPTNADGDEASAGQNADSTRPEDSSKQEKKVHVFTPPVIPEHNLRLVTNIFCCECNSKTFRETISTIKNLSTIPGAKAIFGKELIAKARALGEVILVDLQDLLPQIQKARTGTEIQGVALAKFSPPASDQHKLLRVLTALDHLFDPKREKKDDAANEAEASSEMVEKQDLLSSLYENSTFGPMWEKLSACLSTIRQQDHMLSVATILLPLIESLMVVCKNTTLKDSPLTRPSKNKELVLASPVPESRMENLFFTFTEEHRKILNDLVRHTPKLMSGTFSLLVKNPKVLEFDNKRNYFSRSIHNRSQGSRAVPPLQLSVRREQVFHDSFKSLYFQTPDQMKYGKLSIRFHGEEGVDAGGVTREWFQVLSRQMFDPGYALFIPVSSDRTTFHPNQLSSINEEHLMFFKFIGRIIGKALYEGRVLDCHFSRAVYKRILGKAVSVKDMESLDPDYYKSLIWMLENDITDIITETFSVDNDKFGVVETIDFIEDGRNVAVTEENKHEYVRLMVEWKLTGSVKAQLDEFLKGFHDIIPAELVSIFNEQELELLISGLPEIDVDDWKSNTEYHNYSASSPQIQWFWRAIRSFDKEERAKLLQFVTGTSKVPLNGFKELEGMNGFSRFNIHRDYGNKERLPSSHTCFNQLDLPEYESYETLRAQVLTAITAGSEYFGFA